MNLFIDTTNWKIIYLLEDHNQIVDSFLLDQVVKTSDVAIETLKKFLASNGTKLNQIQNFYLTSGPGSYTGIRVGMTIVKTVKVLNPAVGVYLINSLLFQAGLKKSISLLDARGGKLYCGVYNQGKAILKEQVVPKDQLNAKISQYQQAGYQVLQDYQQLDWKQNFLTLKPHFERIDDVEAIEPLYIKNFI